MSPLPPLFCPACRGIDADGVFSSHRLAPIEGRWRCSGCSALYAQEEGIPILTFPEAEGAGHALISSDVEALCQALSEADPTSEVAREAWLLSLYALSHHPEACPSAFVRRNMADQGELPALLRRWLSAQGPIEGDALELGCGVGGHARLWEEACTGSLTLSDLRLGMLTCGRALHRGERVTLPFRVMGRRYEPFSIQAPPQGLERTHYIVADALDPPFTAEHFKLVCALNLIDTVRDPWMLLGQLDALTAPGGFVLLGQPFHYEAHAQHPEGWFHTPEGLIGALTGGLAGLEHLDYEICELAEDLPWSLPSHARLVHRYAMHLVLAKKRA